MRNWVDEEDGDRQVRRSTVGHLARDVARPAAWVEATVYVRRETTSGKAWLVWDGVSKETVPDTRYGGHREREKWAVLPKSMVRRPAPAEKRSAAETVELPEWLAKDRGLI